MNPYLTIPRSDVNYGNFSGIEAGTLPEPTKAAWPTDEEIVKAGQVGGVYEMDMKNRVLETLELKGLGM